ncbi:MAG: hypothetical protein JXP73_16470 [Deltaproteobacteria bacterium]|nr:hypothetical protein [Deltaproteobacteria bacterium]
MKRALLVGAVLLVLCVATPGTVLWRATSPTTGPRIETGRPGRALLLIDLREDYTGSHAKQPYAESARLIAAANDLIERRA